VYRCLLYASHSQLADTQAECYSLGTPAPEAVVYMIYAQFLRWEAKKNGRQNLIYLGLLLYARIKFLANLLKKLHQKWIFVFSGAAHEWLRSFGVAFQLITPSASKYFTGTSGWVSW
jgi:hypothetical protein